MRYSLFVLLLLSSFSFAWLSGWGYRAAINISNPGSALSDYQVQFNPSIYNNTGLVGSWHFSESSGLRAFDSSGSNNDGTLVNSPAWVSGKFGSGLQFDGVSNQMVVSGMINYETFTVEFWVRPNANLTTGTRRALIGNWEISNYRWMVWQESTDPTNSIRATIFRGSTTYSTATAPLNISSWNHIVMKAEQGNISLIVNNGTPLTVATSGTMTYTSPYTFYAGGVSVSGAMNYMNGIIDEVRIYNRSLSAQEISDYYTASKARLDYADLRFALANDTQIPFWLESDKSAWVKVPSLPSGTSAIYAYYGNQSAASASNGTATFDFFDDFPSLSKWTAYGSTGSCSLDNGAAYCRVYRSGTYHLVSPLSRTMSGNDNYTLEFRYRQYDPCNGGVGCYGGYFLAGFSSSTSNPSINSNTVNWQGIHGFASKYNSYQLVYHRMISGNNWVSGSSFDPFPDNVWKNYRVQRNSRNVSYFVFDDGTWSAPIFTTSYNDTYGDNYSYMYLGTIYEDSYAYYGDYWVDNLKLRKYASSEPSAASGVEQQADIILPAVLIASPGNVTYSASVLQVNFTATDNTAVSSCAVALNGLVNSTTCSNYTLTLANGAYTLNVTASDAAGNTNSSQVSFTVAVDAAPPSVQIQSPINATYVSASVPVAFTASDDAAVGSCTVRLNGTINSTSCDNYSLTLGNGAYVLNITANDTSGNVNSSAVSFSVSLVQSVSNSTTTNSIGIGNVSLNGIPPGASHIIYSVGSQSFSKSFSVSSGVSAVRISARATLQGSPAPGKSMGFEVS